MLPHSVPAQNWLKKLWKNRDCSGLRKFGWTFLVWVNFGTLQYCILNWRMVIREENIVWHDYLQCEHPGIAFVTPFENEDLCKKVLEVKVVQVYKKCFKCTADRWMHRHQTSVTTEKSIFNHLFWTKFGFFVEVSRPILSIWSRRRLN